MNQEPAPLSRRTTFVTALAARLEGARNADGGWGYYQGKKSRIEPTACALIALRTLKQSVDSSVLGQWRSRGGVLIDTGSDTPNVAFNAQALLAARAAGDLEPWRGVHDWIAGVKGVGFGQSEVVRQNSGLQGWPWREGTTSWIEPTSWTLLALKACLQVWTQARSDAVRGRIAEGERLLEDRVCVGGGWNYGNAVVFDSALPPHGSVSAVALLALQDRSLSPAVESTVPFLVRHRLAERSSIALALTAIALGTYGQDIDDVLGAIEAEWAHTRFLESNHALALALAAFAGQANGYREFRV